MAGTFAGLDSGFPDISGPGSTEDKLRAIQDYLVQLLEQLRYTLNNLSGDNFNEPEVVGWVGEKITKPIHAEIENVDHTLRTQIDVTAGEVKSTVAAAQSKYDTSSIVVGMAGYGEPTGTAASGTVYLDQDTGYYYTSTGSAWTKSASPLPLITANLQSEIDQLPDEISLRVKGESVNEWGTTRAKYYPNDVVAVYATAGDPSTAAYYKCRAEHVPAAGNKPGTSGGATYWDRITTPPNAQSLIDLNLDGISITYDNSELASGDHNAAFIKLSKDGVDIGGGGRIQVDSVEADTVKANWVYAGNISADQITAGTLDADEVTIQNRFFVEVKKATEWLSAVWEKDQFSKVSTGSNENKTVDYYQCLRQHTGSAGITKPGSGTNWEAYWKKVNASDVPSAQAGYIGGDYDRGDDSAYVYLSSANDANWVWVSDESMEMLVTFESGRTRISIGDGGAVITASESGAGTKKLIIRAGGIYIQDGSGTQHNLFDLF